MATVDRTKDSNKRSHDSMQDSEGETECTRKSFEYVEKYELKDVMQGISNIQSTLANFMINFESHRNELANIKQDIYGKHGVEERLQLVQSQADDTIGHFTELESKHEKTTREISILKDLVIKLEQKVEFQNNQIIDL